MGESGRSPLAPLKGELSAKLTEGFYAEGTNSACGRGFSCRKAETPQSRLRRASSPFRGAKHAAITNRSIIERPSSTAAFHSKPSRRDTTTVNCTLSTVNSY